MLCIATVFTPGWLNGADPIRDELNKSKAVFESEIGMYDKAVVAYFEKREDAARKETNKKQVAQIKLEQLAYVESGDLPVDVTLAIRQLASDAQKKLETAYQLGAKEYFKAKKDEEAEGVDKELLVALLKAKRATYLVDLKPIRITTIKEIGIGRSPRIVKNTDFDQAVIMHPGKRVYSEGVYKLNKGYTSFRSKVAVTRPEGVNQKGPETAAIFEVLANGRSLWRSKPVAVFDEIQESSVNLRGIDTFILRVHCPGSNTHCHGHWLDPILIR